MATTTHRRGRPPLTWLDASALSLLPVGVCLTVDLGNHKPRVTGRVCAVWQNPPTVVLDVDGIEHDVPLRNGVRGRVVPSPFTPGDPVLRRHVPADEWRGGVVRTRGREVLVETLDGSWEWMDEGLLEPPSARDAAMPRQRLGS